MAAGAIARRRVANIVSDRGSCFSRRGDVLWFAGDLDGVTGLRKIPGVVPQTDQVDKLKDHRLDVRVCFTGWPLTQPRCGRG